MRENLLSISKFLCRQTAGLQLKTFFVSIKFYIVKLPCSCTTATKWKYNCCQVSFTFFFKTELFICIFAPGECPISKGFIDACVFDSVMQAPTVDLQEKSIKIKKNKKNNNHPSFFHCRHKMKYSCYQGSIFGYSKVVCSKVHSQPRRRAIFCFCFHIALL